MSKTPDAADLCRIVKSDRVRGSTGLFSLFCVLLPFSAACTRNKNAEEGAVSGNAVLSRLQQSDAATDLTQLLADSNAANVRRTERHCDDETCLPKLMFSTLEEERIAPEALAGKVVLISLWASWCEPCSSENGGLSAVFERNKERGFALIGIAADEKATDSELVRFAAHYNLRFPVVRLTPAISAAFAAGDTIPTHLLYDQQGRLVWKMTGLISDELVETDVDALLSGRPVRTKTH